ncbi:hypothetical protein RintRC_2238 [Richelia intracellularis]|nr:hypothetical protein RintRC_2238 [Richelia intracellularis]
MLSEKFADFKLAFRRFTPVKFKALLNQAMISRNFQRFFNGFKR